MVVIWGEKSVRNEPIRDLGGKKKKDCHRKIRSMMLPLKNEIKSSAGIDGVAFSCS